MKRRATKEPEHKIPGWLASACDTFAERAADDTPAGAANKLVQAYSCPLLYRTPKSARWWARKQKVRLTHLELLEVIEEVASANAYAFHRRLIDKVHNLGKGARLLRQSTQDERRTRAVQLAHALLHKAQTDIIGKAKNRWKDVEVRVGRLKASLAAKKGVKGRSTFDYDSPGATNMIRRGEFKGLHMGGCSFGSGKDMMRAVVAHANGVDISEVDGYYAVVSVDAGEVQEGETGTTMACRMEDIAAPGALRDDFIRTLQQRCDSVAQTEIGHGVLVAAASATCTEMFNLRAALENRLPTQIKLLARILRDEKFSGYDGIGARWGSMSPQARDAFICVEIKFQAPHECGVCSMAWRPTKVKQPNSVYDFHTGVHREDGARLQCVRCQKEFDVVPSRERRNVSRPFGPVGVRRGSELAFGPTDADGPRAYASDASIF